MLDGKKGVAQNILYEAFKKVEEKDWEASYGSIRRSYQQHHASYLN